MDGPTPRQRYINRLASLKQLRVSYESHWREISEFIRPRRGKFFSSDRNRGEKRHQKVINGTAIYASRVLASGMMAGITSPARPWFRLTTPDMELAEHGTVRNWLHIVEQRLRQTFARSNIYNALHTFYGDLGDFGTAALHVEEDDEELLRGHVFSAGSYAIANNASGRVDTIHREFGMTTMQLVEKFGLEACSPAVRQAWNKQHYDHYFDVVHAIQPSADYAPGLIGPKGKRFKSCWLESAGGPDLGFLREAGYEEFPTLVARWELDGEDVWGSGPGMDALGDARALQTLEKRKAQAVDKIVNPPMQGPGSMRNNRASILPGDMNYVDAVHPGQQFRPALDIHPTTVTVVGQEIKEHELRINRAYFADLWLLLSSSDGGEMTAREVSERHEEKMLQLGPVMERLQDELLDPLIDRGFGVLLRRGELPPPPKELQGQELRVEYISVMAQAQKMLGITGVERFASFVGSLAAVKPDILDKVNWDQMVDEMGEMIGIPPDLVRSDDEVDAMRQDRAAQQQAAMAAQTAAMAVDGAKTLSETDTGGDNALTTMLRGLGGPAAVAGGVKA